MKDLKKAPPLSGRYDCKNVHGCNGCDAVKVGLNEHGYCKECAEAPREGQMKTEYKHTAGPWEIRRQPRGWNIGDIHGNTSFAAVWNRWPNAGADVRLISAAPDLLEAAKRAEIYLSELEVRHGKESWVVDAMSARDELAAAIEKAEGKEGEK